MIMQLEFAVTVANTNANAAKHCPNRKNIFFMYTPLSICQLYNTIKFEFCILSCWIWYMLMLKFKEIIWNYAYSLDFIILYFPFYAYTLLFQTKKQRHPYLNASAFSNLFYAIKKLLYIEEKFNCKHIVIMQYLDSSSILINCFFNIH